jgi:beta-lactamase class A
VTVSEPPPPGESSVRGSAAIVAAHRPDVGDVGAAVTLLDEDEEHPAATSAATKARAVANRAMRVSVNMTAVLPDVHGFNTIGWMPCRAAIAALAETFQERCISPGNARYRRLATVQTGRQRLASRLLSYRARGKIRRMPRRLSLLLAAGCLASVICLAPLSAHGADPLADRIAALTKGFKGTVYLYAKNLTTGRDFDLWGDTKVRTASTIKLPILCALESLVAAGKVRWDERIVLKPEDKVSGSGVLGSLADGTDLTVRNLATLMIIVSDNTATNLIVDRITADAVNDYLDTIGLTQTRSNRKVRGDGTKLAAPSGWSKAGQIEENKRFGLGVSTPREMVKLLELLHQGKMVSPAASKDVIEILKLQQFKTGIGRHTPESVTVASKSGSLDALRSDVGIAYTKAGPIALAITVDGMPDIDYSPDNVGEQLIWQITSVLLDGLSGS